MSVAKAAPAEAAGRGAAAGGRPESAGRPEGGLPRLRQVRAVARKEYMDNVRGRWIIVLSILFVALCLAVSAFGGVGGGAGVGLRGFEVTVLGLVGVVGSLVPILALMIGYASVAGEREQGSLQLLLAYPLTRTELLLGKFTGLGAVLATSIVGGQGLAGVLIALTAGGNGWQGYLAFMGGTLLMALAFLSLSIFFSSLVAKRSTALGLAVFVWFLFTLLWGLLFLGLLAAAGVPFDLTGGRLDVPAWIWAVDLINPGEAAGALAYSAFGLSSFGGFTVAYPGFVTVASMAAELVVWAVAPLGLTVLRMRKLDL